MSGRRFLLHRRIDVTGVSGTGIVADGVMFDDGICVLHWRGEDRSTVLWESLDPLQRVHGHDGATRVAWVDEEMPT